MLILCNRTVALEQDSRNNFYIGYTNILKSDFSHNSIASTSSNDTSLYNIGYLYHFDSLYIGTSIGWFNDNYVDYIPDITSETNLRINTQLLLSLITRFRVVEFENIKFLFGAEIGYLVNRISLSYLTFHTDILTEYSEDMLPVGAIIDSDVITACNEGIIGENVEYDFDLESYVVIGEGVFCHSSSEVEVENSKEHGTDFMNTSIPFSLNILALYGLNNHIDLGVSLGVAFIKDIKFCYKNEGNNFKSNNSYSNYNIQLLINFNF